MHRYRWIPFWFGVAVAVVGVAVLAAVAFTEPAGSSAGEACDWGASSIVLTVGEDGGPETSVPETSGCIPGLP